MTPQEVIARFEHTRLLAYRVGNVLRVKHRSPAYSVVDLPIIRGKVDAGLICHLLSEVD